MFGLLLLGAGAGLLIRDIAFAHHTRYAIDHIGYNPNPATSPYTWAVKQWAVGDNLIPPTTQLVKWCNSLGGYSTDVNTAFVDWDNTLSGSAIFGQLYQCEYFDCLGSRWPLSCWDVGLSC